VLNRTQRSRDTSGSLELHPVALAVIEAERVAAMALLTRNCQYGRRVQAAGDQHDSHRSGGL
jgi:ABC-type xylose transport system permease subunit